MTELEEEGLTGGQGPALSKHRTGTAYRGHAKDAEKHFLEATKRRLGLQEGDVGGTSSEQAFRTKKGSRSE